ncbi:hypothetical protein [Flavobacterium litorale]|uniref:Phage abortive infection protein n=1 Tax=Flavobacterium litorale TaxID=2856519 RepID=A0ABX8V4G8_9FLAO|nr:hypothetical protein [Flavobacterium litorale]QYJ67397.1 hypothetical protein K1I41_07430 [Flavobacterium litorale]
MGSIFNFQFGQFAEASSPNWFDWLSLILSIIINIIAIYGGFKIAEHIYRREKTDSERDNNQILEIELKLFKNSLSSLKDACGGQLNEIETYIREKDFKLIFYQNVNVDFLQFIDIKSIYRKYGINDDEKIKKINNLLSNLYTLYDFRESLRSEFRTYIEKYNFHESKFYKYREIMYTKHYTLCNKRAIEISIHEGIKKWTFNENDLFMPEYSNLINDTHRNSNIIDDNGLKDRGLLVQMFVIPLLQITAKYIPEDSDAIEVNGIANQVNAAYIDMENVTEKHFTVIESYKDNLSKIIDTISNFLSND